MSIDDLSTCADCNGIVVMDANICRCDETAKQAPVDAQGGNNTVREHFAEKPSQPNLRETIAFYIATGGWNDRKKRIVDEDDYAKADAILEYLKPLLKRELIKFPKHDAGLYLTHNEHKDYYQTVAQSIESDDHGYREWVSDEQKQKAIETNECWYLQWYPNSPVGFNIVASADLDALLAYVNTEIEGDKS